MFDKKGWLVDVMNHQSMVRQFTRYMANMAINNSIHHDEDKLAFAKDCDFIVTDYLARWREYGAKEHRSNQCTGSHHHLENVSNMSEVVEMTADWCSAFLQRTHCEWHEVPEKMEEVVIKWAESFKALPWDQILLNTMKELYNVFSGGLL